MNLSLDACLIHGGYLLMLTALASRDILWLRSTLMGAQGLLSAYGFHTQNEAMAIWNFAFVCMNGARVAGLLMERQSIQLPREQDALYRQVFASMRRRDFLLLWEMGETRAIEGRQLIRAGEKQRELVLLMDGEVIVRKDGHELARLGRGSFVAEMSFVTGDAASADVIADGTVRARVWPQEKLARLEQLNPLLMIKLQKILSRDLSSKVKAANRAAISRQH